MTFQYELFGYSQNGKEVMYDPVHSHARTHFDDEPGLRQLVEEVLPSQYLEGDRLLYDVDMNRPIGVTNCVETTDADEIIYAKRPNRDIYTRFTKSQVSQPSSLLALAFKKMDEDRYELASAWIGALAPPFPGDAHETPQSRVFWTTHALVWGTQKVQPGTERSECPW